MQNDPRNPNNRTDVADKAIVAIHMLRLARPPGSTGHGANRDDHPIFKTLVNAWLAKQPIDKDLLFQARARVGKYGRQLTFSKWSNHVYTSDYTLNDLLAEANKLKKVLAAEKDLAKAINKRDDYGTW